MEQLTFLRSSEPKYSRIDDISASTRQRQSERQRCTRSIIYALVILWNTLLIAGAIYGIRSLLTGPKSLRTISCYCGSTLAEARALGCQFDTLSASWLPAQCRDNELTAEFDKAGPGGKWEYWADMTKTRELTPDEVGELAGRREDQAYVWVSWGWHVSHCSFYWRKQIRMAERGLRIERRYSDESHIAHCQEAFLARDPLDAVITTAHVRLGGDDINTEMSDKTVEEHQHGHGNT